MTVRYFLAAICFSCLATSAQAMIDGHSFVELSRAFSKWKADPQKNPGASPEAMFFMGYVAATVDVQQALDNVCYGDKKVTNGQAASVVLKFIDDNPAEWSESAVVISSKALKAAFPCSH